MHAVPLTLLVAMLFSASLAWLIGRERKRIKKTQKSRFYHFFLFKQPQNRDEYEKRTNDVEDCLNELENKWREAETRHDAGEVIDPDDFREEYEEACLAAFDAGYQSLVTNHSLHSRRVVEG